MKQAEHNRLPLVVSIGEPAGIGPDIALLAWQNSREGESRPLPPHIVLCDPDILRSRASTLGIDAEIFEIDVSLAKADDHYENRLLVHALDNRLIGTPANPHRDDSSGIIEAITTGVGLIKSEFARGLVTLPINKKSLYDAGFPHPGHTEFLGVLAAHWLEQDTLVKPVMMLASPELKTVPVTIHIPLMDVAGTLSGTDIIETVQIVHRDLKSRFGIASPRIAIAGLNPHAGENGAIGIEEQEIISPAIELLSARGINCIGPLPADTMFHAAARERYDIAVCMYHDQALIPAKALAFDEAVNVTLGLPFVRTSPDHGTAYDIAGTGNANPSSYIAALRMADEMSRS